MAEPSRQPQKRKPKMALTPLAKLLRRNPLGLWLGRRRAAKEAREYMLSNRHAHIQILEDSIAAEVISTMKDSLWYRHQMKCGCWDESVMSFVDRMKSHVRLHLHFKHGIRQEFARPPVSIAHFVSIVGLALNPAATARIASSIVGFDAVAGVSCAKGFLGQRTVGDWLNVIIGRLFWANPLVSPKPSSKRQIPDEDEFGDRTIEKVHLRGSTIIEAWANDPRMRNLSGWHGLKAMDELVGARDPALPPTWTPATPGLQCVYHGTAHHYNYKEDSWPDSFINANFTALSARQLGRANQLAPIQVPQVSTVFSPLRAFLWAAFEDQICLLTSSDKLASPRRGWRCGGDEYSGIVLFRFSNVEPVPADLRSYIIPDGQENAWGERSYSLAPVNIDEKLAWYHYRDLHEQLSEGGEWPDVVHGLDFLD
ncbi:uncharacterized protein CTRU02_212922 [Colletotrichum truncatum]|uniref:Uncharacterized protein n=1 Tax=Colletotrichum truncatum TaxID=5467 RepID=A0ACC3YJ83_COLTU